MASALAKAHLAQTVQKHIKHTMQQVLCGRSSIGSLNEDERKTLAKQTQCALVAVLQSLRTQGQLEAFQIGEVEVDGHKPFYEVHELAPGLKPGDPYILVEDNVERYEGIVLACDGKGWGLILSDRVESTGAVSCRVTVRPNAVMEYVTIQVKQEQ